MELPEEDYEDQSFSEYNYEKEMHTQTHKKKVRRMIEDRLERKRLREEFMDDFKEWDGDFDWDLVDK